MVLFVLSVGEILAALWAFSRSDVIGVVVDGFGVIACYLAGVWTVRNRIMAEEFDRKRREFEERARGR